MGNPVLYKTLEYVEAEKPWQRTYSGKELSQLCRSYTSDVRWIIELSSGP
jgi:hypothetical protein